MRPGRQLLTGLAVGALLGGALPVVTGSAAYAAQAPIACREIATADDLDRQPEDSSVTYPDPYAEMDVARASALVKGLPGAGVTVAVIDSGIDGRGLAAPVEKPDFSGRQLPAKYYHGTTVAGLIAGKRSSGSPGGIAPGVRLVDLPVTAPPTEAHPEGTVLRASVVGALRFLNAHLGSYPHLIVNMSLEFPDDSPDLRHEVERLVKRGAVVVASAGNRQADSETGAEASPTPYTGDEDAGDHVYPAAYPGVVAVGSVVTEGTPGDATGYVLANSRTDLVAPPYGARSVTLAGRPCVVDEVTTSWSTAEVTGVLALVASADLHDTGPQVVDRVTRTASGRPDVPGPFTGAGVVQAYDAITRPLDADEPTADGRVPAAQVAPPERDTLESTRHSAVWWGLLGGGALVLGLVLRPLLSRRR